MLSHLAQVSPLIDLSSGSRFVAGLVQGSSDATLIPQIRAYAAAHIKPEDRRPIKRSAARVRWNADNRPRIQREVVAWLKARPANG